MPVQPIISKCLKKQPKGRIYKDVINTLKTSDNVNPSNAVDDGVSVRQTHGYIDDLTANGDKNVISDDIILAEYQSAMKLLQKTSSSSSCNIPTAAIDDELPVDQRTNVEKTYKLSQLEEKQNSNQQFSSTDIQSYNDESSDRIIIATATILCHENLKEPSKDIIYTVFVEAKDNVKRWLVNKSFIDFIILGRKVSKFLAVKILFFIKALFQEVASYSISNKFQSEYLT